MAGSARDTSTHSRQPVRQCTFRLPVDGELLTKAGLHSLSGEVGSDLIDAFTSEHERRICNSILDRISPHEMGEISRLFEVDDLDAATAWFESRNIDVPLVARGHYQELADELAGNADRILAALAAAGRTQARR